MEITGSASTRRSCLRRRCSRHAGRSRRAAVAAARSPRRTEATSPRDAARRARPDGPLGVLGGGPRRYPPGRDVSAAERHLIDVDALDELLEVVPRPVEPVEAPY